MMSEKDFVKVYTLGWYHHGQLVGVYLWDIPLHSYEGDMSTVTSAAKEQYKKYAKVPSVRNRTKKH